MKVACIILAAGRSQRFGEADKLLLEINGKPLIRHAVDCALASRCSLVHVVTQPDAGPIETALAGLPVIMRGNPRYAEGIGTSIACGVAGLGPDTDGAMILPADMPWMQASVLNALIEHFEGSGGRSIVYPTTAAGEQRNPVVWPRPQFHALCELEGDVGGRALLDAATGAKIPVTVSSDSVFRDVDTPRDVTG